VYENNFSLKCIFRYKIAPNMALKKKKKKKKKKKRCVKNQITVYQ